MDHSPTRETHNQDETADELAKLIRAREWGAVAHLLSSLKAADKADLVCQLAPGTVREVLAQLSVDELAALAGVMRDESVSIFCEAINPSTLADVLNETNSDFGAHVLRQLPRELTAAVLPKLRHREAITSLLQYSKNTAGAHMITSFVRLHDRMSVDDAIRVLRSEQPRRHTVDTLYVLDSTGTLAGVLTLRQVVLARRGTWLRSLMEENVVSVAVETPDRECVRVMDQHGISSLPVLDESGFMVGVITLRELLHVTREQATADMYHMVGLSEAERLARPLRYSVKKRLPWLTVSLGMALLSGLVINQFDATVTAVVALAAFLPLISAQGTNAAVQTATIFVRSIALGELRKPNLRRAITREIMLGVLNGIPIALLSWVVAYIWMRDLWLAQVLATAMFLTLALAGVLGASVPLLLRRFRADPALGSSVLVATATDVTGFIFLLGIATMLI
jgi:magnesium transporter